MEDQEKFKDYVNPFSGIQHYDAKAMITDCIEGLSVYAALCVQDNGFSKTPDEMRKLINDLVPYWGLDDGHGVKSLDDFLQAFDDAVQSARAGEKVLADTYYACADILNGLELYGREMVVAQGVDSMGEILRMSSLINEVAGYFGYETENTLAMSAGLADEVKTMLAEYALPGQAVEGDNVHNYIVKQAVLFDNNQGFAFAHNPDAASPFVTWRMSNEDGKLSYEWGNYFSTGEKALVDFIERSISYKNDYKLIEKALPEPASELPVVKQLIRFIDSDYRELFKIPDGESIRVTYPLNDGREPAECICNFIDETHTRIGGYVYHICEFAERMEALGARYEPVSQLQGLEIVPCSNEDEKFCTYNREEGNTCAGSIHGDFGQSGDRYNTNWNDRKNGLHTLELQSELQSVIYALRDNILKDRDAMMAYCRNHPEAKLQEGSDYKIYGFKLETDTRQYFVNCFVAEQVKDSRFAIYAYADKPVPSIEQNHNHDLCKGVNGFTSVRKALEQSKRNPKPLCKEKTSPQKNKKYEEEL